MRHLTEHWLEHLERLGRSPKTLEGYRSLIKNGIDPALGSMELAKPSASDIDRFYGLLQRKGLANNTIHHYHACLSAVLHQAVRWRWIDHSPIVRATAPSLRPREVRPLSLDDVRRVLVDLERRNPELACLVFVATTTGCRRGELCGLRWTDSPIPSTRKTTVVPLLHGDVQWAGPGHARLQSSRSSGRIE